jgi:hypothetical protein
MPIGSSINAVAVLEIHIDKKAPDAINPSIMDVGLPPNIVIIFKAILLCKAHSSMAIAIRNPPRNKKMIELIYDDAISSVDIIPVIGKNIRGIREVAAKGSASVIHNIAIKTAIAAIVFTCGLAGSKSPINSRMINAITPSANPNFLFVCIKAK